MSWTFEATHAGYANLWKSAALKGGADAANADTFSDKIIAAEQRYRTVQNATGVPWYFIGALHMREDSCDFAGVLHNGEHIIGTGKLTTLVPAGRGPFNTWEEAAIDALKMKDMQRVQSWPAARMLYQAEVYNGIGYVSRGENSPYVWAGTNQEQTGKFTSDGHFDPSANDSQLGVAAVLIRLAQKRADIHADLYPTATPSETPVTDPTTNPATTNPLPVDQATAQQFFTMIASLAQSVSTLNANVALLLKVQGQTPATPVAPPAAPAAPVTPQPTTPVASSSPSAATSVGIVAAGVAAIMQLLGVPVIGEGSTIATQAVPAVAIGSAALGLSGWGGALVNILGTVVSAFAPKKS